MVEFKQNQWIFVGEWWFLMTWQCSKTWWLMYLLIKYISYTHLWSHVRDINDMINIYSFFFCFSLFSPPFQTCPWFVFSPCVPSSSSSPFKSEMSSIFPPELLHHYINGPMRKYFNTKLRCAHESTHSCCEARLGNPIIRTVMQRSSIVSSWDEVWQ